jgi:hypothetical protein
MRARAAYVRSIGKGTTTGFNNTPIQGPLNTSQTPSQIPQHFFAAVQGTPPQFVDPLSSDMNTNVRQHALRAMPTHDTGIGSVRGPGPGPGTLYVRTSAQRTIPVSSHVNYIPPTDADLHLGRLKAATLGRTVFPRNEAKISTGGIQPSTHRSALRRVRASGATAPKKKGASSVVTHGVGFGAGGIRATY